MSLLDDIKNKTDDALNNPKLQQAKDFAEKHGISLDQAKKKLDHKDEQ